ncbi:MAG: DivIVA domain protein [Frankiales bacterium]|nr:DivIVA domain protein [Frankiales bacterium]
MSTTEYEAGQDGRRLTPADVQSVRFTGATMLHPGYTATEVDRFLARTAQELARLHAEKAELRDHVHALSAQLEQPVAPEPPSDQAVRLLATAQQTADDYVAEAEEFSRQMAADSRTRAEEQLRHARETAGAIIQAAQEAAQRVVADGGGQAVAEVSEELSGATRQQLEEQVAYLKAFAQACRVQLRSYLEALLTDVESEWGRANPALLPEPPVRTPAQRSATGAARPAGSNVAREMPMSDSTSEHPVVRTDGTVEVVQKSR